MAGFMECESINVNYNVMGIATITYTWIDNSESLNLKNTITIGGVQFEGWITDVYQQPMPKSEHAAGGSWYTTNVTMIAVS